MSTPSTEDIDSDADQPDEPSFLAGMTELVSPAEFAAHFSRRGDRLFHSHSTSLYPLPVDAGEQHRYTALHNCLRFLIGAHFVGPLRQALLPGRHRRRVVDFGTGIGSWPLALARIMRHVVFFGIDMAPIATRYPPPNVYFVLHDINSPTDFHNHSIDVVHARDISLALNCFGSLVWESARILRSGGLFISGEWDYQPCIFGSPFFAPYIPAPGLSRFLHVLHGTLYLDRGARLPNARTIPLDLLATGVFTRIVTKRFYFPIGTWPEDRRMKAIGKTMRHSYIKYAEAMRGVLARGGISGSEISVMIEDMKRDLFSVPNLVLVYHAVWARRS